MKKQKNMFQFILMFALCMMVLVFPSVTAQAKVRLSKTTAAVSVNSAMQLKVKGTKKKVKWSSTNKSIATVTSKGVVRGIRTGNCYIKAKVGGKTYKCKFSVVGISNNTMVLQPGNSGGIGIYNGYNSSFYSSNYAVATVNANGVVTAHSYGTACITCVTRGVAFYCTVYVPQPTITSKFAKVGEQFLYGFYNCPTSVSFASSNPSVVTVASNGVCTAVGKGYAVVVANVGGFSVQCPVLVAGDDAVITPTSWINGSTRTDKVDQAVKTASGYRVYSVYGQAYSANYVKNFPTVSPNGVDTAGNLWLQSTMTNPTTGMLYTARIYNSYMSNHGCAACSLATILSAYKDYKGRPYDIVANVERKELGESVWLNNYLYIANVNTSANQMPLSLYGMQQIMKQYDIDSKYVRSYSNIYTAWNEISEHLLKGKPVIIEVTNKNTLTGASDTRWANSKHTMILLGITDQAKVIVADPADRSSTNFGSYGRIKLVDLSDVGSYMFSSTATSGANLTKPYYTSEAYCGGYILVDEK